MKVAVDVKNAQATEETRRSDMGDKKAGKRPTPSFLRQFLRFPREPPSVSLATSRQAGQKGPRF
jgi:hypothetical protein